MTDKKDQVKNYSPTEEEIQEFLEKTSEELEENNE